MRSAVVLAILARLSVPLVSHGVPMPERVLPREFPTPPEFLIPLSNAELQELGTFTAIWSQIDSIMLTIVHQLTGTPLGALQLMMETMTTGPRINLLKKLCQ